MSLARQSRAGTRLTARDAASCSNLVIISYCRTIFVSYCVALNDGTISFKVLLVGVGTELIQFALNVEFCLQIVCILGCFRG